MASDMPKTDRCPIGALGAHTYNYERTECIWCGPHKMAWKPGRWVSLGDGLAAWSIEPEAPSDGELFDVVGRASGSSD